MNRLGRSLKHLVSLLDDFHELKVSPSALHRARRAAADGVPAPALQEMAPEVETFDAGEGAQT